jgi:hypothetical protein
MYELGFYIPENGIPHSNRRENLRTYTDAETSEFYCGILQMKWICGAFILQFCSKE